MSALCFSRISHARSHRLGSGVKVGLPKVLKLVQDGVIATRLVDLSLTDIANSVLYLKVNNPLYRDKAGDVNQHGAVFIMLAPQTT